MSEKNGQGEQQWTKGAVAATLSNKQIQQCVGQAYGTNVGDLGLTTPANALFGSPGHIASGSSQHGIVPYASARFHAPPIDHHVVTAAPVSSHIGSPSSNSVMSAPSGFVPPPFSSSIAATTSVLTPNPFAVASLASQSAILAGTNYPHNAVGSTNQQTSQGLAQTAVNSTPQQAHGTFGVDQFQHLNAQQHYELSKLMAATFGSSSQLHAAAGGPTNLSSTAGASLLTTTLSPDIQNESQSVIPVRQHPSHSQPATISNTRAVEDGPSGSSLGAINIQVAEQVIGTISSGTSASKLATTPIHGRLMGLGIQAQDDEKLKRIQQLVEASVGEHAKQQIVQILDRISTLRPVEKLLLYLRLPGEQPETDPLRQPQNPLGTRSEINHTINWVRTHLEQDPQVSIPKQDVYNDYLVFCDRLDIKPLSTADFGKVMKQVFPGIRPRRLGTRGHSRYCYAAMRKTSKLPAPHLPTLSTAATIAANKSGSSEVDLESESTVMDSVDEGEASWDIVKHWAETTLQIKVKDLKELAKLIKSNAAGTAGGGLAANANIGTRASSITNKKCAQREPKEKRAMADMGPLKKRRKKKRKGSSSSESSYNPSLNLVAEAQQQTAVLSQLSPANSSKSGSQNVLSPAMEDSQKSMNLANIKQEFIDSPGYPSPIGATDPTPLLLPDNKHVAQYHSQLHKHHQQQQVMPINLASEAKGGVTNDRPSSTTVSVGAFENARISGLMNNTTTAVKNLTPKIMELSVKNQAISSPSLPSQTVIKQEVGADDYNTSNIFCKKVRKAQQTKGYWVNSPTSSNRTSSTVTLPIITTTASTPPPTLASVITSPQNSSNTLNSSTGITTNYCMGPPAQMAPSTSPNNHQSMHDDVPKVLSRNLQQLRAKKLMAAAATVNCDPPDLSAVKEAADLPENLGLPRERVISICNMDKHELDDYFLPVEEENSEEQDTELLQYFQMGDAEEKLIKNSSSDAKKNSDPTVSAHVAAMSSTTQLTGPSLSMAATSRTLPTSSNNAYKAERVGKNDVQNVKPYKQLSQQALNYLKSHSYPSLAAQAKEQCTTKLTSKTTSNLTVGTASASLEQTTQKHQHQQKPLQNQAPQLHQPNQPQQLSYTKVSNKRKINLNSSSSSDITAARKNYSFLPISPNINTASSSTNISNNSTGFFASPGFTRLLAKQQSLDCDSSCDPMIGATRKRRTYVSAMSSASAPPSPSVLKQQQEQQILGFSHNILMDQWPSSNSTYNNSSSINPTNALVVDQNSLDLDLFGEDTAAATSSSTAALVGTHSSHRCNNIKNMAANNYGINILNSNDGILNELTQRSRSVPLSQLQRSHSPIFNRTFQLGTANPNTYSTCNSLVQTPVSSEFVDSVTMLSENSCSQHSASIKLEEVGNVVGSDSTALLDEVDVCDILSSPDFVTKFSSIAQTGCGTKTTCSSAGSSSGYSSAGHFPLSLSSSSYSNNGSGVGCSATMSLSISRSVPSTPLPNQNPSNIFGGMSGNSFYRRRFANNCQSINSTADNLHSGSVKYGYGNMSTSLSRSVCDISKSMPSTPITTTPSNFRYSPSEFTRDFLINGNTIDDSITNSFGTVTNDNLIGCDVVGLDTSLLNEEDSLVSGPATSAIARGLGDGGVVTPDFTVQSDVGGIEPGTVVVGESSVVIGVGSNILDSL